MIHCRSTLEKFRACCADGSAMFMIVMSRTIISWASPMSARISQRRWPGSLDALGVLPAPGVPGAAISVSHLEMPAPFTPPTLTEVERQSPLGYKMAPMDSVTEPADRPLRKDAERNRQRILKAAAEVFTDQGLAATLDDVARQAGVGVGTVYRRFPDKAALADALFEQRIDILVDLATEAHGADDPWEGLAGFMLTAAEMLSTDKGLRQILMFAPHGHQRVGYARNRMRPAVRKLGAAAPPSPNWSNAPRPPARSAPTSARPISRSWNSCSAPPPSTPAKSAPTSGAGTSPSCSTPCARPGISTRHCRYPSCRSTSWPPPCGPTRWPPKWARSNPAPLTTARAEARPPQALSPASPPRRHTHPMGLSGTRCSNCWYVSPHYLRKNVPDPGTAPQVQRSRKYWTIFSACSWLTSTSSSPRSPCSHSTMTGLNFQLKSRLSDSSAGPSSCSSRRASPDGLSTVRLPPTIA